MTHSQFLAHLIRLNACSDAIAYVKSHPTWSIATLLRRCERPDWLLWLAGAAEIDRKTIVRCACDCARTALRYATPGDDRPRLCVETVERWCDGGATMDDVYAAESAARSATCSAESAARSAAWSAEAAAWSAWYAAKRNAAANHCRLIRKRITAQMIIDALEAQEKAIQRSVKK